MYRHFFKRLFDVVLSLSALVVLAPVMIVCALIIKHEDKGSAFFTQKRIGIHKKPFSMYKFRSMRTDTPHDTPTHLLENPEQYILHCGKWMRKYSVDELPQIFNILRGDMSIVGPRPALWNQYDLIAERDKYGANDIKPGLTGWAQINGRDELEISEKARLDGEYLKRESFTFDLMCIWRTVFKAAKHEGVVEGGTG
ncbi:MAG: sugar transferase, partial [Synergistaceae bacterium]|nr:sugar transferase [Synergistaceae bacterium]